MNIKQANNSAKNSPVLGSSSPTLASSNGNNETTSPSSRPSRLRRPPNHYGISYSPPNNNASLPTVNGSSIRKSRRRKSTSVSSSSAAIASATTNGHASTNGNGNGISNGNGNGNSLSKSGPINMAQRSPSQNPSYWNTTGSIDANLMLLSSSADKRRLEEELEADEVKDEDLADFDDEDVDDDDENNPNHGERSSSGTRRPRKRGEVYRCEKCSKQYRHPQCLIKHRWQHTTYWNEASKLMLSKHQQVQMLEAAAILSNPGSLPDEKSLWPAAVSPPQSGLFGSDTLNVETMQKVRSSVPPKSSKSKNGRRRRRQIKNEDGYDEVNGDDEDYDTDNDMIDEDNGKDEDDDDIDDDDDDDATASSQSKPFNGNGNGHREQSVASSSAMDMDNDEMFSFDFDPAGRSQNQSTDSSPQQSVVSPNYHTSPYPQPHPYLRNTPFGMQQSPSQYHYSYYNSHPYQLPSPPQNQTSFFGNQRRQSVSSSAPVMGFFEQRSPPTQPAPISNLSTIQRASANDENNTSSNTTTATTTTPNGAVSNGNHLDSDSNNNDTNDAKTVNGAENDTPKTPLLTTSGLRNERAQSVEMDET